MTTQNQISVWPDDTEGRQNRSWIVSLDKVNEVGGNTSSTKTLDATPDYDEAIEMGKKEAQKRGLALVENDEHGVSEIIIEAK